MSVFIPIPAKDTQLPPPAKAQDSDVTRFARLSWVIGLSLTIASTAATFAAALWGWFPSWRIGGAVYLSLLALAWFMAGVGGGWWTYHYKVRRPAKLEDDEMQLRFSQVYAVKPAEPETVYIEPQTVKVKIIDKTDGKHQMLLLDLPCSRSALYAVAKLIASGKTFSEASMTGKDKPLARGEHGNYAGVRDEFIGRGLLRWKDTDNPNQGLEVTKAGMAYFRHLASHSPTDPASGAHAGENKG